MIPILLKACPSFQKNWDDYRKQDGEEVLYFVVLGDFAHHLLDLYRQQQFANFPAVASAIEQLLVEGDNYVREAATVGLLEGIQNGWANSHADPGVFFTYLLPVSAKSWGNLNDFWNGKT